MEAKRAVWTHARLHKGICGSTEGCISYVYCSSKLEYESVVSSERVQDGTASGEDPHRVTRRAKMFEDLVKSPLLPEYIVA
jgi:hypothetical protein